MVFFDKEYKLKGRSQTQYESDVMHGEITNMLNEYGIDYIDIESTTLRRNVMLLSMQTIGVI